MWCVGSCHSIQLHRGYESRGINQSLSVPRGSPRTVLRLRHQLWHARRRSQGWQDVCSRSQWAEKECLSLPPPSVSPTHIYLTARGRLGVRTVCAVSGVRGKDSPTAGPSSIPTSSWMSQILVLIFFSFFFSNKTESTPAHGLGCPLQIHMAFGGPGRTNPPPPAPRPTQTMVDSIPDPRRRRSAWRSRGREARGEARIPVLAFYNPGKATPWDMHYSSAFLGNFDPVPHGVTLRPPAVVAAGGKCLTKFP